MNTRALAISIASVVLVSGCASTATKLDTSSDPATLSNWNSHQIQISKIDSWEIVGRFSARSKEDAWTGSLSWQQKKDVFEIQISGPLNQGNAVISGNRESARLVANDKSWTGPDPETILNEHLGLSMPVNSLRYWMLGIPSPSAKKQIRLDAEGTINELVQDGWTVRYKTYSEVEQNRLPTKVFIERGQTEVRFVFDQWRLQS